MSNDFSGVSQGHHFFQAFRRTRTKAYTMSTKDVPSHIWLLVLTLILGGMWEYRPDAVVQNLLLQAFGATLMALVPQGTKLNNTNLTEPTK